MGVVLGIDIGGTGSRARLCVAGLQRSYYQQPHLPREWARHAGLVIESGDPAAKDIVARAGSVRAGTGDRSP